MHESISFSPNKFTDNQSVGTSLSSLASSTHASSSRKTHIGRRRRSLSAPSSTKPRPPRIKVAGLLRHFDKEIHHQTELCIKDHYRQVRSLLIAYHANKDNRLAFEKFSKAKKQLTSLVNKISSIPTRKWTIPQSMVANIYYWHAIVLFLQDPNNENDSDETVIKYLSDAKALNHKDPKKLLLCMYQLDEKYDEQLGATLSVPEAETIFADALYEDLLAIRDHYLGAQASSKDKKKTAAHVAKFTQLSYQQRERLLSDSHAIIRGRLVYYLKNFAINEDKADDELFIVQDKLNDTVEAINFCINNNWRLSPHLIANIFYWRAIVTLFSNVYNSESINKAYRDIKKAIEYGHKDSNNLLLQIKRLASIRMNTKAFFHRRGRDRPYFYRGTPPMEALWRNTMESDMKDKAFLSLLGGLEDSLKVIPCIDTLAASSSNTTSSMRVLSPRTG